ncbi:MAG: aminoglycoside phosphotransferase family protein [Thermodesulfobacteriota bacterium]
MPDYLWTARLEAAAKARGVSLTSPQTLAGDGSDRRFYRLLGSPTAVLLFHPSPAGGEEFNENDSYYHIGRHLKANGVPVPEIYTYCREEFWLLLEDLGDISLETVIKRQPQESQVRHWYRQALEVLVNMQIKGREGFDTAWCFDTPTLHRPFLWERECGYFVRAFLNNYLRLKTTMEDLAPDFERLLTGALPSGSNYFLHRDYQSRNLFITSGRLRVIDFQGGRLGPLGYDLASLLIDPYVNLSPARQQEFLDYYLDLVTARLQVDPRAFREQYYHLALCRNLQILGAYGYLTKVKGKDYFARYIPPAVEGLRRRLAERPGTFPRLEELMKTLPAAGGKRG